MESTTKPRAPRMVKLFVRYSKRSEESFIYNGLEGSIVYRKTNVPGEAYSHPVVKIVDGNTCVLEIHREIACEPRTKEYVNEYSDRLDVYMEALEKAIVELETANRRRIGEDNKRRKELRIYENNLF